MGAKNCHHAEKRSPKYRLFKGSKKKPAPPPDITENEVVMLRNSWIKVKEEIEDIGVFTFIGLFESHPDIKHAFVSFRGLQPKELNNSSVLRAHALRVMTTVDKCLFRFDNLEKVEELMKSLGCRHGQSYQVIQQHLDLMAPHFNYAIKHNLKDQWTPELELAWDKLFRLMIYYMKSGMT